MTSFKRFESKPVVKIIYIYTHCNLWHHRQFITIFYQFLHIRIEIIPGSHMYILFLPRVGLYVSFLTPANARGKTSWHKGLLVVKTIYIYQGRIQDFKLAGGRGTFKKIAPSGGRRENLWGISCEKSWFYAKKSYFFSNDRGGGGVRRVHPPWIRPCIWLPWIIS
jgi:hypothetical protein